MNSNMKELSGSVDLSVGKILEYHTKILKAMCPAKDADHKEQMGYYNYYCHYYFTEEEEHKLDSWKSSIESVYWNMTKRIVMTMDELLKIIVLDEANMKSVSKIIGILEEKKHLVRASKIFSGKYYIKEK